MNVLKMVVAVIIATIGFLYLVFAYAMIGWGWSDSGGHWCVAVWMLNLIPWSVPFLLSLWIIYRCVGSNLKYTLMAEVVGFVSGLLFLVALRYSKQESSVVLEKQAPIVATTNLVDDPNLPLSCEAVGMEAPDGKFNPIMFLSGPVPRIGYKKPLLTVDLAAGAPRIKTYRGTNEWAVANHFLGQFQVVDYSKTKQSLVLMIVFFLDEKNQLSLQVRDVDAEHNTALKLKRVDTTEGQ
jgi:hypothetical protein